jgi:Chitobiase/beta-hexosaminidase C-terminal domain/Divergent InlB B-repeat domain
VAPTGIAYHTNGDLYLNGSYSIGTKFGATTLPCCNLTFLTKLTRDLTTDITVIVQGLGSVAKSPDRASYEPSELVTLTAIPARWFAFTRWGDGATNSSRNITIGPNNSYTAVFSPTTAVETLTFGYASRTAPVGMPAIFADGTFILSNEVTRLDSTEISMRTTFPQGAIFYTLDGSAPDFGANLYAGPFVLRRSANVRAVAYDASFFNPWEADPVQVYIEPTYTVNVWTTGGGTVGVAPDAAAHRSNEVITLNAMPAPGWKFLQWLGDATGTSVTTSVRVGNRDLCAQALFGTTLRTTSAGNGEVVVDSIATAYHETEPISPRGAMRPSAQTTRYIFR